MERDIIFSRIIVDVYSYRNYNNSKINNIFLIFKLKTNIHKNFFFFINMVSVSYIDA